MSTQTTSSPGEEPEPESLLDRMARLISEGKYVTAVRRLRAHTGLGFSECTRVVNALQGNHKDGPRWD